MVFGFKIEDWLGAYLFDDNKVLFAARWHALNNNVLDLPDDGIEVYFGGIGDLVGSLNLLG